MKENVCGCPCRACSAGEHLDCLRGDDCTYYEKLGELIEEYPPGRSPR